MVLHISICWLFQLFQQLMLSIFPHQHMYHDPYSREKLHPSFKCKKKKTQGRWVVHRVSKQTKNQSNHIDKLEQMEKSNLQLSVDCIGFVLLHSLFGPEYLCHLLK